MRLFLALLRDILSLDPRLSPLRRHIDTTIENLFKWKSLRAVQIISWKWMYGLKERIMKCPDLVLGPDGFLRGRGEKVWH